MNFVIVSRAHSEYDDGGFGCKEIGANPSQDFPAVKVGQYHVEGVGRFPRASALICVICVPLQILTEPKHMSSVFILNRMNEDK